MSVAFWIYSPMVEQTTVNRYMKVQFFLDPFHYGHKQLIDETINLYDELNIIITYNKNKNCMYGLQKRKHMIENFIKKEYPNKNINILLWDSVLVDLLRKENIQYLIRGIRNGSDFEYEQLMYYTNKEMYPELKMHYIISKPDLLNVSSSMIKELLSYNKDISKYTPIPLAELNLK